MKPPEWFDTRNRPKDQPQINPDLNKTPAYNFSRNERKVRRMLDDDGKPLPGDGTPLEGRVVRTLPDGTLEVENIEYVQTDSLGRMQNPSELRYLTWTGRLVSEDIYFVCNNPFRIHGGARGCGRGLDGGDIESIYGGMLSLCSDCWEVQEQLLRSYRRSGGWSQMPL